MLSNSGHIDGAVDLLGGSGDTLDNFGLISGNVALAGGDIFSNQGQVYGDVTLAGGDTLIDTGAIHGDVTLESADSFDASQGGVAGTIGASSGDLFEFGSHIGAETRRIDRAQPRQFVERRLRGLSTSGRSARGLAGDGQARFGFRCAPCWRRAPSVPAPRSRS